MWLYELSHPDVEDRLYIVSLFKDKYKVLEDIRRSFSDDMWSFDFDYSEQQLLFQTENLKALSTIEHAKIPKKYLYVRPYFDRHFNSEETKYSIKEVIEDLF